MSPRLGSTQKPTDCQSQCDFGFEYRREQGSTEEYEGVQGVQRRMRTKMERVLAIYEVGRLAITL
jgi:hypothetical protein